MQPDTKVKENGQSVLEKLDARVKENNSPAQQWDYLAFQIIYNELAPRGFKKQKNGFYKGTEYVEVPKKTVLKTQKIAAQLVRGFREKAKQEVKNQLESHSNEYFRLKKELNECGLFMFRKKSNLRGLMDIEHAFCLAYQTIEMRLDQTPIK